MTLKTFIGAGCSFLIPGLGQLFYGRLLWAAFWLVLACCFGPLVNLLSAAHVFFVSEQAK
jgi:hypothetical protein